MKKQKTQRYPVSEAALAAAEARRRSAPVAGRAKRTARTRTKAEKRLEARRKDYDTVANKQGMNCPGSLQWP